MVSRHTATLILASNASSTSLLNITVVFSYSFPAPSDYPQNVESTTISSTEILVSWDEVQAVDQNGIILLYEVQYEPLITFGGQLMTMAMTPPAARGPCSGTILAVLFREERAACFEALIAASSCRMSVVNVLENRYGRCTSGGKSQQLGRNSVLALTRDHRRPSDRRS